jgi:hypothetical protein
MAVTKILIFLFVLIFICRFANWLQGFTHYWRQTLGETNMNPTAPFLKGFAVNDSNIAYAVFKLRNVYEKFTVG